MAADDRELAERFASWVLAGGNVEGGMARLREFKAERDKGRSVRQILGMPEPELDIPRDA